MNLNMQMVAEYIGYVIMIGGIISFSALFLWFFMYITYTASNRFTHLLVDMLGGWKTFLAYRDWYCKNNENL